MGRLIGRPETNRCPSNTRSKTIKFLYIVGVHDYDLRDFIDFESPLDYCTSGEKALTAIQSYVKDELDSGWFESHEDFRNLYIKRVPLDVNDNLMRLYTIKFSAEDFMEIPVKELFEHGL